MLRKAAEDVLRRAGRPAGDMSALTSRLNETMVHPGLLSHLPGRPAGDRGGRRARSVQRRAGGPVDVGRSGAPGPGRGPTEPHTRPGRPEARGPEAGPAEGRARRRAGRAAGGRAAELLERRRAQATERLAQADAVVEEAKAAVHDAEAEVKAVAAALERERRAETAARTRFERADVQRAEVAARVAALDD